jgi:ectoine hydroxylase-related dioxygenase (phytanoyl-CoA dioxygenase family)
MTDEERYLFDLNGFLVVRDAIAPDALAEMNAWIDRQEEMDSAGRGQHRAGNLLTWGPRFRALIDNPVVLPYLKELMGDTLRLDHDYAIFSEKGGTGLVLHGGGTPYDPAQYYHCYQGRMYNGLTVASYALTDIPPGAGGLAVVPGSHKANFSCPDAYRHFDRPGAVIPPVVQQVSLRAGDCAIFTEALTHGTFPWQADHQRRSLFFKYSPRHLSWAKRYYFPAEGRPEIQALEGELTEAQRILLDPPSVHDHRRVP